MPRKLKSLLVDVLVVVVLGLSIGWSIGVLSQAKAAEATDVAEKQGRSFSWTDFMCVGEADKDAAVRMMGQRPDLLPIVLESAEINCRMLSPTPMKHYGLDGETVTDVFYTPLAGGITMHVFQNGEVYWFVTEKGL